MTDWRYWITYTRTFSTATDDEDVAVLAAAELHADLLAGGMAVYPPEIEVELVEGTSD